MEALVEPAFWKGRRVLVTGHTGFKGGWLCLWLQELGAEVAGYSLELGEERAIYRAAGVGEGMQPALGDVRDLEAFRRVFEAARPEIVFHLAARAFVRRAQLEPCDAVGTNVLGTLHALELARASTRLRALVIATSDKCYENKGWDWGYREIDELGGSDVYSASKASAELLARAYRESFFGEGGGPAIATVRAGNVLGGGDWGEDRLLPDLMRAAFSGRPARLRYPSATRPWQHVLDVLAGYLLLAEGLVRRGPTLAGSWNLGPPPDPAATVASLAARALELWGEEVTVLQDEAPAIPEAQALRLDAAKAARRLGWRPRLSLQEALQWSIDWYRACRDDPGALGALSRSQIEAFAKRCRD